MTALPLGLAPLYPYRPQAVTAAKVCVATLVLLAVSALALWQVRRRPALLVGWCWYLGTLLPVSGLFQSGEQALADRFTYFPSLGLALAVTWGTADALEALRWPAAWRGGLAVAVLLLCAVRTGAQTLCWRDSVTLWTATLRVTRDNGMAHHNLGEALEKRRQWPQALAEFDRSLAQLPRYAKAHFNRGVVLEEMDRLAEAEASLRRACELDPGYVAAHYNRGVVLFRLDRFNEAAGEFQTVLRLAPEHARAAFNLGQTQLALGAPADAVASLQTAVRLDPSAAWYKALGQAWLLLNHGAEAAQAFRDALELDPADAEARAALTALERK